MTSYNREFGQTIVFRDHCVLLIDFYVKPKKIQPINMLIIIKPFFNYKFILFNQFTKCYAE